MKHLTLIFLLLFISCRSQDVTTKKADEIETLATELCENFNRNWEQQSKLQLELVQKEILKDTLNEDVLRKLNTLNYKLTRYLWKNCSKYQLKSYTLGSLLTRVLDIDNTFSNDEFKNLENQIKEVENLKKIQIMVVTIDDLYPYKDAIEYSIELGNKWGIGKYPENGGVMIILDKQNRQIRISTDEILRQKLTDEECSKIIQKATSFFKEKEFYNGLSLMIEEIKNNI